MFYFFSPKNEKNRPSSQTSGVIILLMKSTYLITN